MEFLRPCFAIDENRRSCRLWLARYAREREGGEVFDRCGWYLRHVAHAVGFKLEHPAVIPVENHFRLFVSSRGISPAFQGLFRTRSISFNSGGQIVSVVTRGIHLHQAQLCRMATMSNAVNDVVQRWVVCEKQRDQIVSGEAASSV